MSRYVSTDALVATRILPTLDDQPACAGNSAPFDVLIDYDTYASTKYAAIEAADMCEQCPLMTGCLTDPDHQDWAPAIVNELRRRAQQNDAA